MLEGVKKIWGYAHVCVCVGGGGGEGEKQGTCDTHDMVPPKPERPVRLGMGPGSGTVRCGSKGVNHQHGWFIKS